MKSTTTVRELTDMTPNRHRWVEAVQDQGLLLAHLRNLKLLTGRKIEYILTAMWKTEGSLKEEDDVEILKHLLFPSEKHVRGCWCLDMILGYE